MSTTDQDHRIGALRYRDHYTITYDPPPIPWREDDWSWVHDDYGWRTVGRHVLRRKRRGTGSSVEDCQRQIDELEKETP